MYMCYCCPLASKYSYVVLYQFCGSKTHYKTLIAHRSVDYACLLYKPNVLLVFPPSSCAAPLRGHSVPGGGRRAHGQWGHIAGGASAFSPQRAPARALSPLRPPPLLAPYAPPGTPSARFARSPQFCYLGNFIYIRCDFFIFSRKTQSYVY